MSSQVRWPRWATLGATAVLVLGAAGIAAAQPVCIGDCNDDKSVTANEIVEAVRIAKEPTLLSECPKAAGVDNTVSTDDLVTATNNAIVGCQSAARCGDRVVQGPDEECDNGGICIGGNKAGQACTSDDFCGMDQPGVCDGGAKIGWACRTDDKCPDSKCVRCKTFGGSENGCASNCTFETSIAFDLQPGVFVPNPVTGPNIKDGTSGAKVYGAVITNLPLKLTGTQDLTIGKKRNGQIPVIIKAASVHFPKIQVATIACSCIRGLAVKTCGGTLFTEKGELADDCSEGIPRPVPCPADGSRPCTFVNGPGNAGAGVIGCEGLAGSNVTIEQDCNYKPCPTCPEPDPFPPSYTLKDEGGPGSAFLLNTIQIGRRGGPCPTKPSDPPFCVDSDPVSIRGDPDTLPFTTGSSTATAFNISNLGGNDEGPHTVNGTPFSCANLTASLPSVSGGNLATSYPSCDRPVLDDNVVTINLVAK